MAQEARGRYPRAALVTAGLSTGAFLTLHSAATVEGLSGAVCIACVRDTPSSWSLDFDEAQVAAMRSTGSCLTPFYPHGKGRELWELGAGYLDSYSHFAPTELLAPRIRCPVLLVHGTADRHVPYEEHAPGLAEDLRRGSSQRVELVAVEGANHFFSSEKHMRKAQAAVAAFVASV
eukprot:TRINITY_DN25966_c0_g1_i2.p2 TRINITY_DN25966_c0_g1~~TRINITY_DN25966_c0_g1_i2.p2  ORF type:complete len:176 (+),score=50.63 TRINITY_DN25966_c0_g1_i2:669-1196(+)